MNQELLNVSPSRSWRDIPQPVKPRAMSAGGRLRLAMAVARASGAIMLVGALGWGVWQVAGALRTNPRAMPAAAKAVPIKHVELQTSNGGVLDDAWLGRTLALAKGISLMELDLERLRARVLADGQVLTATLTRNFPDRLTVQVSERSPVARIKVSAGTEAQVMLVARDGVVYLGSNYDPLMLATLPWLGGFTLKPQGAAFRPIPGMDHVADLLARAQYEATHLYITWQIVSLERLESDHELEVTTKNGSRIVFTTTSDFFPQLAKLDNILGHLRDPQRFPTARAARARIDLSLGREVPVMIEPTIAGTDGAAAASRPALAPGFNVLPSSLTQHSREL